MKTQVASGVIIALHGPSPDKGVVIGAAACNPMYRALGGFRLCAQIGVRHMLYFAAPVKSPDLLGYTVATYHIEGGRVWCEQREEGRR